MASVAAVLPVPANANVAPSPAAKPAVDDFHAVLASYAPAQDRAAAHDATKSTAPAPREASKRNVKDAKPDPTVRDGASKGSKKAARDRKADTSDVQDSAQAQPVVVAHPAATAILRDVATVQPPVAANSDDADDSETNALFDAQVAASASSIPADVSAKTSSRDLFMQTAAESVSNDAKSPAARSQNADVHGIVDQALSAAAKTTPAKAVLQQAADTAVAASKNTTQPQTPVPQTAQPLQSSIVSMLTAMRGAITVTTSPKQAVTPKADTKADQAATATKIVAKSPDLARTIDLTPSDDEDAQPVPAPAPISGKPAPVATTSKANLDEVSTKTDPRAVAHDGNTPAAESPVSDKGTSSPAPAQPMTVAPQASNTATAAVAPNATANVAQTASQLSVSASATHLPQEPALQPNLSALATAIAVKSASGTKTFDIRMDPPELGRVDVHLSVDRDGKVQATLSAEHPQTLELLQRDSQTLERSLKDAGLNLSNNSLNFSLKGEGRQGDGGGASRAQTRSLPDAVVARAEAANASVSNFNFASGNGRLDIRV